MKTLVIRLDHLGDLMLTTPLVRALALGGHTVDVLVRRELTLIFDHSPYIHQCFGIEDAAPNFPRAWWQLGRWLRRRAYDVILLPYAREKRLCFASMISGAKRRIAMWSGIYGRLTFHECLRSEILTRPRPFSEILLRCAYALGIAEQGFKPDLFLSDAERRAAANLIPSSVHSRPLIGLHPGVAGNACNLPSSVYSHLAEMLIEKTDFGLILTGTANEQRLLADWPRQISDSSRVWNSMGKLTLRQLASIIAEMQIYVCPSTGPLHLASAVGTPTVSPFCPTAPLNAKIWGNVGAPSRVIEPQECPRRSGVNQCCDFREQISAVKMFCEIEDLLAAARVGSKNNTL